MDNAVTVVFSDEYNKKMQRLAQANQHVLKALDSQSKNSLLKVAKAFQDGLKSNTLDLVPLQDGTIKRKKSMSYSKPSHPLYGMGLDDERSYINMLRLRKLKNKYKLSVTSAMHHSGKVKLKTLFYVHENGATITIKSTGAVIRIPPRPAFRNALNKTKLKTDSTLGKQIQSATTEFVNTGKMGLFKKLWKVVSSGLLKILEIGD